MKTWFHAKTLRERMLVTVFILMIGAAWALTAIGRVRSHWSDWQLANADIKDQDSWLTRQAEIEQRSAEAVKNLDPAKTFDATRLVATLSTLTSSQGLGAAIDPPRSERTSQFAYHTTRVTLRRAALPALLNFQDELAKLSPYLTTEQISVETDRGAPGMLNVTLQVSATQVLTDS